MATTTTRIASRAAAALLAAASLASLSYAPAFAAPASPTAPSADSAPAAPAAPAPAVPTPVAPAPAPAAGPESDNSFTKGTQVWFRNDTGSTVWVREHHVFTDWYASEVLQPGESAYYSGNYGGVDDVQLRIFRSAEDARENSVFKAIEVDAENPAWSSPWLSVSYQSKYYSVGTVHFYVSPIAGAAFKGQRHGDSDNYKRFELTMTKGWNS